MEPQTPQDPPVAPLTPQTPNQNNTDPVQPQIIPDQPPIVASKGLGAKIVAQAKKRLPLIVLVIGILILLGVASATAYFVVIVPNKPENKLAVAIGNLAKHDQLTVNGKYDQTAKNPTGLFGGFTVDYTAGINLDKNIADITGEIGISGAKIPYSLRYVDQDIYVKVNGLTDLLASLSSLGTTDTSLYYSSLLSGINNQWYVIDRSLFQQAGSSAPCVADINFKLTDNDASMIRSAYKKHPLFSVKNTSREDVDGVTITKYELDPASDEEAKKFANELTELSVAKKIKACIVDKGGSDNIANDIASTTETSGTMYAYITADGQLKKIEINGEDDSSIYKFTMNFDFSDVNVDKPEGAKSFQELLSALYGGSALTAETQFNTLVD